MSLCEFVRLRINVDICKGLDSDIHKGSSWKLVVKCVTQRDPTPAAGQQLPNNLLALSSVVLAKLVEVLCVVLHMLCRLLLC